jgi:hypothetical protein
MLKKHQTEDECKQQTWAKLGLSKQFPITPGNGADIFRAGILARLHPSPRLPMFVNTVAVGRVVWLTAAGAAPE